MSRATMLIVVGIVACALSGCDSRPRNSRTTPESSSSPLAPSPLLSPTTPAGPPPPTSSSDALEGSYSLTLELASECTALPDSERTRRYAASIASTAAGKYIVTLYESRFLSGLICDVVGLGCNQFVASRQGDAVEFDLANNNDDGHGGHIVEQLSNGTWAEIIGAAKGLFRGSAIEASGQGSVWYCRTSSSYPFPCSSVTSCKSSMRLMFTRR